MSPKNEVELGRAIVAFSSAIIAISADRDGRTVGAGATKTPLTHSQHELLRVGVNMCEHAGTLLRTWDCE